MLSTICTRGRFGDGAHGGEGYHDGVRGGGDDDDDDDDGDDGDGGADGGGGGDGDDGGLDSDGTDSGGEDQGEAGHGGGAASVVEGEEDRARRERLMAKNQLYTVVNPARITLVVERLVARAIAEAKFFGSSELASVLFALVACCRGCEHAEQEHAQGE